MLTATRCSALLETLSRMDLGQRAVSCNHAVGLRAAQMHRVHSVDGPNVRACGVLRDLGFAAKGGTLYAK